MMVSCQNRLEQTIRLDQTIMDHAQLAHPNVVAIVIHLQSASTPAQAIVTHPLFITLKDLLMLPLELSRNCKVSRNLSSFQTQIQSSKKLYYVHFGMITYAVHTDNIFKSGSSCFIHHGMVLSPLSLRNRRIYILLLLLLLLLLCLMERMWSDNKIMFKNLIQVFIDYPMWVKNFIVVCASAKFYSFKLSGRQED